MRLLATVLNIVLIGIVIFLAAPTASLFALYTQSAENWLSLFLKRKALEEKKKIELLNSKEAP